MAVTKTRNRDIDISDENAEKVSGAKALIGLMIEVYQLNLAQNAAKKAYDTKRKELYGKMKLAKLKHKVAENVSVTGSDNKITLEAKVATPQTEKADVTKLHKLVDIDTFLLIVSATKEAVTQFAGGAVFEQVKHVVDGNENVSVGLVKE